MKHTAKTYFIPHAENNYHPHILHSKRALFYSAFFIGLKVLIVVFVALLPSAVYVLPDVLNLEQNRIISLTNNIRAREGLLPLSVEPLLTNSSQAKANDMARLEYFSHTNPQQRGLDFFVSQAGYDYLAAGENLAMGFYDADELMAAWVKSKTHYSNIIDPDYVDGGVGIAAGNYDDMPTMYVAHHFGAPKIVAPPPPESIVNEVVVASEPTEPAGEEKEEIVSEDVVLEDAPVLESVGESSESTNTTPTEENAEQPDLRAAAAPTPATTSSPLTIESTVLGNKDAESAPGNAALEDDFFIKDTSRVFWKETSDGRVEIMPVVYLEELITEALLQVQSFSYTLEPGEAQEDGSIVYTTRDTLPLSVGEVFRVIVPASLELTGVNGEVVMTTVQWDNALVISPTPIEKYVHAKRVFPFLSTLFAASQAIYLTFLVFFSVSLLLMISVEIRQQHPHIIVQTLGMLLLLVVLYIA
jgi:hypothetical protein